MLKEEVNTQNRQFYWYKDRWNFNKQYFGQGSDDDDDEIDTADSNSKFFADQEDPGADKDEFNWNELTDEVSAVNPLQ